MSEYDSRQMLARQDKREPTSSFNIINETKPKIKVILKLKTQCLDWYKNRRG